MRPFAFATKLKRVLANIHSEALSTQRRRSIGRTLVRSGCVPFRRGVYLAIALSHGEVRTHAFSRKASERGRVRVYFHLVSRETTIRDEDGLELCTVVGARCHVLEALEELRAADTGDLRGWAGWRLKVVDSCNEILFQVRLERSSRCGSRQSNPARSC